MDERRTKQARLEWTNFSSILWSNFSSADASPEFLLPVAMGVPALDGRAGTNRASTPDARQVGADDDLAAIGLWLAEFAHSPHTLRSYRKEAVRLVLWATRVRGKAVSSLTREDVLAYEAFLANPTFEAMEAMLGGGQFS